MVRLGDRHINPIKKYLKNIPPRYRKLIMSLLEKNYNTRGDIVKYNYYYPSLRMEYNNSKGFKKIKRLNPHITLEFVISIKVYNSNKVLYIWGSGEDKSATFGYNIIK